ncbi:MAG: hypothetical protein ACI835_003229 [Planctomycetota bacterium]|jgi:hypothetical protein
MNNINEGRVRRVSMLLLVTVGFFACFSGSRTGSGVARQNWWDQRGPVVPHDDFPADCTLCHTGSDWETIRHDFLYDHGLETGTVLHGAHTRAECLRCHNDRGPVSRFAARGCAGCHEDVHEGELGQDCTQCHSEVSWRPEGVVADHSLTRFPLLAAHASVACWRCHEGAKIGDFSGLSTECSQCHMDDLASALEPNHQLLGWTHDCQNCHRATRWDGSGFRHSSFPLTGAHRPLDCNDCHRPGDYGGLSDDCSSCHAADYATAMSPDHAALNLPMDCEQCHSTRNWEDAFFSHSGLTQECAACHQQEYKLAEDPDHIALDISMECQQCHGTNTWQGAEFSHAGIESGCVECHLPDYQDADDPDHIATGFSTDCEQCHGTQDWAGADFNHDFPIDAGDHSNIDCIECHIIPRNFAIFSCIDCHEHRQGNMDDEHEDEDDYVWATSACYQCHPNGDD